MEDPFQSIRPYNEREARFARLQLIESEEFNQALKLLSSTISPEEIVKEYAKINTIYDFQYCILKRFVDYFIQTSMSQVDYFGIENLKKDEAYLFIANHRDIVMDAGILQNYFFNNLFNTSKIAFGNNLISSPILDLFAKLNKLFIVKRDSGIRERLANYQMLSEYIKKSILDDRESVWIAQRNGRTKDGIDKTQQGLVKMLAQSMKPDILGGLKKLNIVPVTISYEYESCDLLKARELSLSENQPYVKAPGEDFASIKQGIFGYKGACTIVIGTPITNEIDAIDNQLHNNEKIVKVCQLIDNQIYSNYKLYATNYMAYDMLEQTTEFSQHYSEKDKADFTAYLAKQSAVAEVSQEKMLQNLLKIYANPVKTKFGKAITPVEEHHW